MTTLFICDYSNLIIRDYFGLKKQELRTKSGIGTWGVYGALNTLVSHIKVHQPDYLLLARDGGRSSKRVALYPEYKANRHHASGTGIPDEDREDLLIQMEMFLRLAKVMGLYNHAEEGVEADDIISTVVHRYRDKVDKIVMLSADHDLKQLLFQNVILIKPQMGGKSKEETFTREMMISEYGVVPERLPEIWALEGDSSDNIPGAKGIGPVTAKKLIEEFGNLSAVTLFSEKVIPYTEDVQKAFKLIQLDDKIAKCDFDLQDIAFNPVRPGDPFSSSVLQMLEDLEFNNFKQKWLEGILWEKEETMGRRL